MQEAFISSQIRNSFLRFNSINIPKLIQTQKKVEQDLYIIFRFDSGQKLKIP